MLESTSISLVITEEAPNFLQQGYFHGPLGNAMVLAISNALGLPVIIFSSTSHYPIINNIVPRTFKSSIPLYIAFNQAGAGHYDAVSFRSSPQAPINGEERCSWGKSAKHYSTNNRCTIIQFKYTTSIRCPCLLASRPCSSACNCSNCGNPKGIKPNNPITRCRECKSHAWNLKTVKSVSYAKLQQETILSGPRTQLEYLLVAQILKLFKQNHIDTDIVIIHKLILSCVELVQAIVSLCFPSSCFKKCCRNITNSQ